LHDFCTHTHTHRTPVGAALALLAAMSLSSAVEAQRFRCTPLVKLGMNRDTLLLGTMGINDEAQVVYGYVPYGESNITAWLWLHVGDYGQPAGFHELRDISSPDAPDPCIAREINEAGYIAGVSDQNSSTPDATFWNMGSSAAYTTAGLSLTSEAFSVNDDSPPKLTGWRTVTDECQTGIKITLAFRWELTGGSGTLTDLDPASPHSTGRCIGYDIGLDDTVSGNSNPCSEVLACTGGFRGTGWESSEITLSLGSIGSSSYARTNFGYGVDDTGRTVGWTFHQPTIQIECRSDTTLWESPSDTTPANLGSTMPSGQSGDESRAFAINNLTYPQVVGTNLDENVGVLWERNYLGVWSATDLNTEIPCCRQNLVIIEAHDINDNGWIVAWAEYVPPSGPVEQWAVLLSPYTCPEDVDFDGDVDVNDLNAVYFSDGNCPAPGGILSGDVDNDCDVDSNDFAQIVAAYGDCSGGGGEEGLGAGGEELALTWLAAGGAEGLDSEDILMSEVAASLEEPTPADRITALFSLLND